MSNHSPTPWRWTDHAGRINGKGKPVKSSLQKAAPVGQGSTFAYSVIDSENFVIAHCTNPLVTMSTERSEANARLIAAAPELLLALQIMKAAARQLENKFAERLSDDECRLLSKAHLNAAETMRKASTA